MVNGTQAEHLTEHTDGLDDKAPALAPASPDLLAPVAAAVEARKKSVAMGLKSEKLFSEAAVAASYFKKVGMRQNHTGEPGTLGRVEIKTVVNFQAGVGATPVWEDRNFDRALAEIVRREFDRLGRQAIELLQFEAEVVMLEEEDEVRQRLQYIEALRARRQGKAS